jgi:hypothetical protein
VRLYLLNPFPPRRLTDHLSYAVVQINKGWVSRVLMTQNITPVDQWDGIMWKTGNKVFAMSGWNTLF